MFESYLINIETSLPIGNAEDLTTKKEREYAMSEFRDVTFKIAQGCVHSN